MRRVLVTGSSRGIGRAIAQRLAKQGYAVTLHCRRSRKQADALARELNAPVLEFDRQHRLDGYGDFDRQCLGAVDNGRWRHAGRRWIR